jgi:hypothetical protein
LPSFRTVTVTEVLLERPGLTRVRVRADEADAPDERAYALTDVTGPVAVGDEVVVNTTAIDLGLGTGGWHVVHWNLARRSWSEPGGGHIVKARYTSVQHEMEVAEERGGAAEDLGGVPVVACSLHSQVGVVAAVLGHLRPGLRVAYVMTDGGALPLALSDLVVQLRDRGLLVGTVTTGHAFGGDQEAVTIPSGLAVAAGALGADVIVAGMGPGVVGTGSRLGFTGLDQATILDSTAWLGGRPVTCLRASDGDGRVRHQGVSHHSLTVLDATRSGVDVPVPAGLAPLPGDARHTVVEVDPPDVGAVLAAADLRITTMGRGPDEDPLFFQVAAAAAVHAAALASS